MRSASSGLAEFSCRPDASMLSTRCMICAPCPHKLQQRAHRQPFGSTPGKVDPCIALRAVSQQHQRSSKRYRRGGPVCTYPEPETEKERSSVDIPQEWITPQPSRRPDVQPEFEKLETPLPRKLPGDPEQPDEEEEEEEKEKEKPEEDPEEPEQPPGEE